MMSDPVKLTAGNLPKLAKRQKDAHKGVFGKVLVLGGSRRMVGAPALAGKGAFRGGAGLVTIATPGPVQLAVAMLCECATTVPLACDTSNKFSSQSLSQFTRAMEVCDIIVAGCGFAVGNEQQNFIRAILEQSKPVVLDADGLNNLLQISDWQELRKCPLVLTPHPAEFARLRGCDTPSDAQGRLDAAVSAAREYSSDGDVIVLLKGAGTVVTDGRCVFVNETGNPGMATGGSGDVLSGLIAGLAMQGISLMQAACLGAHIHGLAGDIAATELTEQSMMASDILDRIPAAMKNFVEP